MSLIQKLSNSLLAKPNTLCTLVSTMSILGTLIVLLAGIWDAASHALREPELFWTIQHITVYWGVGMISSAAFIGAIILAQNFTSGKLNLGLKIVIVSSVILIISGFGDSLSHEVFGIDGLLSWSHQPLEFGLVLATLGGFLILKHVEIPQIKILEPFSILTVLLSVSWLGFNLALLIGSTIQCVLIYKVFSSGCAVL